MTERGQRAASVKSPPPLEASPYRELCLTCRRPKVVCWCDAVTPVSSTTHVVFLQHPREAKVAVSTCRMAHNSLPNSELHIGITAVGNARLEALCALPDTAVLFPSDTAVDVSAVKTPPKNLIVVDGTWSNAKKVVEKCPVLSALPRLAFTPDKPGNYRIRKEPAEHCLATIEATAFVLEKLENAPGRFTPMLSAFDAMVDKQLEYIRSTGNNSRHKRVKLRAGPKKDHLEALRRSSQDLVVVFGEANAWPMDNPDRPADSTAELIQLVAQRVMSGEMFQALLRPKRPISPSATRHLDLNDELLRAAPERAAVLAQWEAFLRPDDVLVGWGHFCQELLAQEGFDRAFLDVRSLLAQARSRRPGPVECFAQLLGVDLPEGEGRAARRRVALTAVTRAIVEGRLLPALKA